jgi:hypothetical protein
MYGLARNAPSSADAEELITATIKARINWFLFFDI